MLIHALLIAALQHQPSPAVRAPAPSAEALFDVAPVAADGRLYFASEDGDVFVVKAGAEYVELGKFSMNEVIMATPAISDGMIVVRTLGHVYGLGTALNAEF